MISELSARATATVAPPSGSFTEAHVAVRMPYDDAPTFFTAGDAVELALDILRAAAEIDPTAAHETAGWVEWLRVECRAGCSDSFKTARQLPSSTSDEAAMEVAEAMARQWPGRAPYRVVRTFTAKAERTVVVGEVTR